jgi:hypothetical protein
MYVCIYVYMHAYMHACTTHKHTLHTHHIHTQVKAEKLKSWQAVDWNPSNAQTLQGVISARFGHGKEFVCETANVYE